MDDKLRIAKIAIAKKGKDMTTQEKIQSTIAHRIAESDLLDQAAINVIKRGKNLDIFSEFEKQLAAEQKKLVSTTVEKEYEILSDIRKKLSLS